MNVRAKKIALITTSSLIVIFVILLFFKGEQEFSDQKILSVSQLVPKNKNVDFGIPDREDIEITEVNTELKGPLDLIAEIGGQEVKFTLKPLKLNEYFLPEGDGLYLYNKLSLKAQDDPIAARLLSKLLVRCSNTHLERDQHDESIARLLKSGEYPANNSKKSFIVESAESIELVRVEFEHDFEQCKNLSQEKRDESTEWAKLAADGGDYLGLDLLIKAENISTSDRVKLYEKKWTDFGDMNSAINLSQILSGIGSIESDPRFIGLEPDPPKAYAYFLASSGIELAISEKFNSANIDQLRHELSIFEQLLSSKLTVSEHLDAEKLAIQLIEKNSNCCSIDTSPAYEVNINGEE